jgi:hypothetical protein
MGYTCSTTGTPGYCSAAAPFKDDMCLTILEAVSQLGYDTMRRALGMGNILGTKKPYAINIINSPIQ